MSAQNNKNKKPPQKKPQKGLKPEKKGLMTLTLTELEKLEVKLGDVISVEGITLNLTWDKVIRLINYIAGRNVLSWKHTFQEALELIKIFLM